MIVDLRRKQKNKNNNNNKKKNLFEGLKDRNHKQHPNSDMKNFITGEKKKKFSILEHNTLLFPQNTIAQILNFSVFIQINIL